MIGRRLSHYDVVADLGSGGMGVVYRAHDTRLERDVAIKVLPTDRPLRHTARARFQREAMAASALNHPNIITIYEINSQDDIDFIVMEYVRGVTLSSALKKRTLGLDEAIRYCIQIADALAKAHAAGIVHRDLKPGNIMITEDGLIKVLDFGLAKFEPAAVTVPGSSDPEMTNQFTLTQPGMITGTVAYMSPEQARGEKVDARTDIFSFGVVMFEVLSGQLPFIGPNSIALLHNLHFSAPRDLTQLRPDVPQPLVTLVSRMLEKEPDKRIQTMAEVASALRRGAAGSMEGPLTWHPSDVTMETVRLPTSSGIRNFSKRRIWAAGGALALILAAAAGAVYYKRHRPVQGAGMKEPPVEDNAYALYQRARYDLDHFGRPNSVENAIKLLERALQLDPQSAASYAALGEAYYLMNHANPDPQWMKLASENATKAVSLDNYLAAGHISMGLVQMQSGDSNGAEKQFQTAADLNPKSSSPHDWLAQLYLNAHQSEKVAGELKRALELDPKDWRIYSASGMNAYQAGNYKEAASNWEQAVKLDPDNLQALRNLGGVYHMLNRDDDAIAVLQRAIVIHPSADIYNNLGTILFFEGKYDAAVPAFEKTVELSANDFENWGNLGDAYRWSTTLKNKATDAYRTSIRLVRDEIKKNPLQMDLRADLAMYLAKSGDKASALQEIQPVTDSHPKDPSLLYNSAVVYELCGNREKALESLQAAVKGGQDLHDIQNEPEFVSLRADPRYHLQVVSAAANNSSH